MPLTGETLKKNDFMLAQAVLRESLPTKNILLEYTAKSFVAIL